MKLTIEIDGETVEQSLDVFVRSGGWREESELPQTEYARLVIAESATMTLTVGD